MKHSHKIVGVIGSGTDSFVELAAPLGEWIARQGFNLLTGAGAGVMNAVSEAFFRVQPRPGLVLGIVPGQAVPGGYQSLSGYPNEWVEIPIFTHLPDSGERGTEPTSRNHINVLSSDVLVALPGQAGTKSEVALALKYRKPLIAYLGAHPNPFPAEVRAETSFERVKAFILETLM